MSEFLQLTSISIDTILIFRATLRIKIEKKYIYIYQRNDLGTIDRTTLMIKISIFTLAV